MITSLNKSLIILLAIVITLSCSKNEADPAIVPEPTAQEMILGTWNINEFITDSQGWSFEQGEATVTFREDSVMVFQNNGIQTIIPQGESQRTYFIDKFCSTTGDISCPFDERIDLLVTYLTVTIYNTLLFEDNGNTLTFGRNYVDGGDYYCTKINDIP